MEIDTIYYKAKDGRLFTDPLKCEDYEKTLGILPGSVADLISQMEKLIKPESYIFGIVFVRMPDGQKRFYVRCTCCVDDQLESFVNVKDLTWEQRYLYETAGDFMETLRRIDKDAPCQYMIVYSGNIDFNSPGIIANHNKTIWEDIKDY